MELTLGQWAIAIFGALMVGLGKGGLPGAGNITIWLYVIVFGSKASVGILLPVLICADLVAIFVYRSDADWGYIRKLFPITAVGVILGFFVFDNVDHEQMRVLIGYVLLGITALHFLRKWLIAQRAKNMEDLVPHTWWFISGTGLLGGFATMIANAAGPVASFYFMAIGLPKMTFIGTSAWFFFLVNIYKLPFQAAANNLSVSSLQMSLILGAFAALGALIATRIVKYIPQKTFETLVWIVIVIAGFKMIL